MPASTAKTNQSRIAPLVVAVLSLLPVVLFSSCATKQSSTQSRGSVSTLEVSTNADDLVDVEKMIPGIVLDIRYATTNNFTGQKLYPVARCCLRREAAENLKAVQDELHGMGLALKVFDGYRPLSVQRKMWAVYPHAGFVADPAKGSRHNRGAAVDLTLIRLDGTEVPMPTPFDDFTPKAHRNFKELPPDVIKNRDLLERVMTEHHFRGLDTEWWHFDFRGWRKYPLLDVDYSQIK